MFATLVYQENKMDFYAAWDLADQQRSTEEPGKSLKATRKHRLPAPLVARSDPYLVKDSKKFEEEEDESDSSSDSSSEDKKTDGLDDDESDEQEKKQQVEARMIRLPVIQRSQRLRKMRSSRTLLNPLNPQAVLL